MIEHLVPPSVRRLFRLGDDPRSVASNVDDEIAFHIAMRVDALVAGGMDPRAARERAEQEYGDLIRSHRELVAVDRRRLGRVRREEILMSMLEDLRYTVRGLRRSPAVMALTIAALTVGIAATTVMFGVVDQLLIEPPAGVTAASQVHRLYFRQKQGDKTYTGTVESYPLIAAVASRVPAFSGVSAFFKTKATLGQGRDASSVDVDLVSGNYFSLLGVRIPLGRAFTAADDHPPVGSQVAVVSDAYWRGLGAPRDIIGRLLPINGKQFTIIGVAPAGFSGLDRTRVDLWVPIGALAADVEGAEWNTSQNAFWVEGVARLRPDLPAPTAESQTTTVFRNEMVAMHEPWLDTLGTVVLGSINDTRTPSGFSPESKVSLWLMGVAVVVLLIACANVANLLLARAVQRRREIAVRLALGVSRGRLFRQLLTEAAVLGVIAAAAALIVTRWLEVFVEHVLLPGIVWSDTIIDRRVLAFTVAVAILAIVLAGIVPAVQGVRTDVSDSLKESSRQVAGSRGGLRVALLVVQAALSLVLLIGAGLFVTSLRNVVGRNVGIDLDHTLLVTMDLKRAGFSPAQAAQAFESAHDRAPTIRGVRSAALVSVTIPARSASAVSIKLPGGTHPQLSGGGPYYSGITDDFFRTTGARIVQGRAFTPDEERSPSRVMIVNQMLADAYWPGENPVGKCYQLGDDPTCTRIVGVVQTVMLFGLVRDDRATLYLPPHHPMVSGGPEALLVRTAGDPQPVVRQLRSLIQSYSPRMPFVSIQSYADIVAPQLRPWRLGASMFTLFGAIALVIAAVGLYCVMAYWVAQRTHEIGVRIALGAQRFDVVRLVSWQALRAVGVGVVLGAAVALFASRWLGDLLYETSPHDPTVYVLAALALFLAAALASVFPARRSASVDPVIALRAE